MLSNRVFRRFAGRVFSTLPQHFRSFRPPRLIYLWAPSKPKTYLPDLFIAAARFPRATVSFHSNRLTNEMILHVGVKNHVSQHYEQL